MITRRTLLARGAVAGGVAALGIGAVNAAPKPHDPLLDLVKRYRAERARVDATHYPDDLDLERDEPEFNRLWETLKHDTPPATTREGAVAGLRLASEEMQHSFDSFEKGVVAAALAYFEAN